MSDRTYTPAQFAQQLFMSASRVRTLTREGVLHASASTPGGHRRYTEADLTHARKQMEMRSQQTPSSQRASELPTAGTSVDIEASLDALLARKSSSRESVDLLLVSSAQPLDVERIAMRLALAWREPLAQMLHEVRLIEAMRVQQQGKHLTRTARVSTFASPRGGSARSTTALNYAAQLARTPRFDGAARRVLLIDGNIGDGTLAVQSVGKPPQHGPHAGGKDPLTGAYVADPIPSLLSLINYIDDRAADGALDEPRCYDNAAKGLLAMRDFVLTPVWMSGHLDILAAPDEPDFVADLQTQEYHTLLDRLSTFYDDIVIDAGSEMWANYNQVWYERAHTLFVMIRPELAALNSCRKFVRYITRGRDATQRAAARAPMTHREKLRLVVLGASYPGGLNIVETMRALFSWATADQVHYWADHSIQAIKANSCQGLVLDESDSYTAQIQALIDSSSGQADQVRESA